MPDLSIATTSATEAIMQKEPTGFALRRRVTLSLIALALDALAIPAQTLVAPLRQASRPVSNCPRVGVHMGAT